MTIKQQGGVFGRNPAFNDVSAVTIDATTVDAERLNVTAGADSIAAWIQGRSSDNAAAAFFTSNNGGTQYGYIFSNASEFGVSSIGARPLSLGAAGSTAMQIDTSGNANILNGNLIVANGKGIDFSATSGTGTSELFDDYEEGMFTPSFANLTIGDGSVFGRYTKIGRTVNIELGFTYGSTSSISGSIGDITGLPFTSASINSNVFQLAVGSVFKPGTGWFSVMSNLQSNTSQLLVTTNLSGVAITPTTPTVFASGTTLTLSITYEAA